MSNSVSRQLARRAAAGSMVLMANNGVLPLATDRELVHLTGPFVNEGEALLGTWVLDGRGDEVVSPATAFRSRLAPERLLVSDGRFSEVTVSYVRAAQVTVALVGEHPSRSGEDRSISTLELPAGQLDGLRQLAGIGKPLVVVVYTGRPLELGPVLELADAVVVAWHPGVEAGTALADLIFGAVEPSGRLPMTFPRSVGHLPTSSHQRPTGRPQPADRDADVGRYLDALVQPQFPFGFGLSYTTVEYGPVTVDRTRLAVDTGSVRASVLVGNTGDRPVAEVVQLYLRDLVADVTRPLTELADWQRVELAPGEQRRVEFDIGAEQFGYFDRELRWRVDPGEVEVTIGPHAGTGGSVGLTLTAAEGTRR